MKSKVDRSFFVGYTLDMNISEFLKSEKIFEYAVIDYKDVTVTDTRRENRIKERFEPKSVLFFLMPYYVKEDKTNISRYAHARDYHFFVKELESRAKEAISVEFAMFADTSPVAEVAGCVEAGLGCVGKNGLLINPRYGSYVFIGEFFFPLSPHHEFFKGCGKREKNTACLSCLKCESACRTGGIFDRSRCVSFINQKKKLDEGDERIIKESSLAWGCDVCQEVCPMNKGEETPIEFFKEARVPTLSREILNQQSASGEFERRAYAWRGEAVIRRNVEILEK